MAPTMRKLWSKYREVATRSMSKATFSIDVEHRTPLASNSRPAVLCLEPESLSTSVWVPLDKASVVRLHFEPYVADSPMAPEWLDIKSFSTGEDRSVSWRSSR